MNTIRKLLLTISAIVFFTTLLPTEAIAAERRRAGSWQARQKQTKQKQAKPKRGGRKAKAKRRAPPPPPPLRAQCYALIDEDVQIEGQGANRLLEIASVSKVATTYWALQTWGPLHRFETRFHVTPVDEKQFDIHIEGDNDPYFSMWQFYFSVAELNKLGINKIRNLTFDENFEFLAELRDGRTSTGRWEKGLSAERVMRQLRQVATSIVNANKKKQSPPAYVELSRRLKSIEGIEMPKQIRMEVADIQFSEMEDYQSQDSTRILVTKSLPLHELLKEMNRNSNNFSAEIIFAALGGAKEFNKFMLEGWNFGPDQIFFVNGSGNSIPQAGKPNLYNRSTCSPLLNMMAASHEILERHGLRIEDVLAVAGEDSRVDDRSTTSKSYSNDVTSDAVAAKTGSVNPSVALAGVAHTRKGDVYFYFNSGTRGPSEWSRGRVVIKSALMKLIKLFGGPRKVTYDAPEFAQVDKESFFVEISPADKKLDSPAGVNLH
jgi:hypothetical protein